MCRSVDILIFDPTSDRTTQRLWGSVNPELHLYPVVILWRLLATVRLAAADPGERAKLVEDIHDGHLGTGQLLGHCMPGHQVGQALAEAATLRPG